MKKSFLRVLSALLVCVMLIGIMPAMVFASEAETDVADTKVSATIPFSVPAIFADAGETVKLSDYSVMFDKSEVTPFYKVGWSSGTLTVTDEAITPSEKGVYTVTATSGTDTKTIYVVVKEKSETEYVLYHKDFSTVESFDALVEEGYAVTESKGTHTFTVSDGRLNIGGHIHQDPLTVSLPMWLADFGDYTVEADIEMTGRQSNTRFWGIAYNYTSNASNANYPNIHLKVLDNTSGDNYTLIAVDRRSARWTWQGAVDGTGFAKDIYQDNTEHTYKMEIYGTHLSAYVDNALALDTEYVKNNPTGAIGFFSRGAGYSVSEIKVTLDKSKIDALYDNFVDAFTPAIFADAGETVDLSQYAVSHKSGVVMSERALVWSSEDITVTDGKVTPAKAGLYRLTATPAIPASAKADMSTTVYLAVKNAEDKEYVIFDMDYADVTSVDDLTEAGYVMAEIPSGNTVTVENGALAIKGDGSNKTYGNVNARVILPEWLYDFGNVTFSSDIKITKATTANRYFSLMYRVQNDSNYYPLYTASFRANGANDTNFAPGLNSSNTPNWKTGVTGTSLSALNDGKTHNYSVALTDNRVRTYVDNAKIIDSEFIGKNSGSGYSKGYLGYFLRDLDIEIYNTKVTIRNERADVDFDKLIGEVNPAILADTGDTVDLTQYAVECDDYIMFNSAVWTSDDITITNGKVTPAKPGVYTFTVKDDEFEKEVYLLVKDADDTEYVLYDIDFSEVESVTDLTDRGFIIAEQPSAYTIGMENDALAIKGAADYKNYNFCRVLLPEWISAFGNYSMTADIKMLSCPNTNRYFALMYRVQNDASMTKAYYPLYTATFRAKGSGHNLSYASNATPTWGTGADMSSTSTLLDNTVHNYKVSVYGNTVKAYSDDLILMDSDYIGKNSNSAFDNGYLGYMVIGADVEIYNTRVVYIPEKEDHSDSIADVKDTESDVVLPATTVTYINTLTDLESVNAATSVLRLDKDLNVVDNDGNSITTLANAIDSLGMKVIPAFYVSDSETATALTTYLKQTKLYDLFVISDDTEILKSIRAEYKMARAVLDFSDKEVEDLYDIRKLTNESGARVCILPTDLANKKNVEYLQRLFITVWTKTSSDTPAGMVGAITTGANGIITQNASALKTCYTKFFDENTAVRTVGVVAHQGVYYLAQPNTVKGSQLAYELGATAIENDIHLTKDGVIVAMHNDTIDSATNGTGAIADMTLEQLRQYKVDSTSGVDPEPISTLSEYFDAFKGLDVQLIVEIKSKDLAIIDALKSLIEEYDIADQVNIITFEPAQALKLKEVMPEMSLGYLVGSLNAREDNPEDTLYNVLDYVQTYNSTYNPSFSIGPLGANTVTAASHRGITVWPYTINTKADLSKYIGYGVSAITTNNTNYFSDCIREISTDSTNYVSTETEIPVTVNTLTYDRTEGTTTDAKLVFVDGDDIFSYENGNLVATGEGSATLMFSYECTDVNGSKYNLVTETFTATVEPVKVITGTAGPNATYSLDLSTGVLTVDGTGPVWSGVPAAVEGLVKEIVFSDGITEICDMTYTGCYNVEKVTLPEGLKVIGKWNFYNTKITEITLPSTLTKVGDYAFGNSILESVEFADTRAVWNNVIIGEYNTVLNKVICNGELFDYPTETTIWVYDGVDTLYLSGTGYITSFTEGNEMIPDGIAEKVKHIVLDETIAGFGAYTFSNMPNLERVTGGENMRYIGNFAFKNCKALETVEFTNAQYFGGVSYGAFMYCESLESITLSEYTPVIYGAAFRGCISLKEVVVPEKVKTIGEYAFWNCTGLETLEIKGATSIGAGSVQNCTALKSVILPDSLLSIGNYAFYGANADMEVSFNNWDICTIGVGNTTLTNAK